MAEEREYRYWRVYHDFVVRIPKDDDSGNNEKNAIEISQDFECAGINQESVVGRAPYRAVEVNEEYAKTWATATWPSPK